MVDPVGKDMTKLSIWLKVSGSGKEKVRPPKLLTYIGLDNDELME